MRDNEPICALYCRCALADEAAMQKQKHHLRDYAQGMGYKNTVAYLDNGYSGNTAERPGFAKLNADIEAGAIRTVLATDHSRLWRDVVKGRAWQSRMDKLGVTVLCQDAPVMQMPAGDLHTAFVTLDKRKKRKQARHTVRTPPPASKTR